MATSGRETFMEVYKKHYDKVLEEYQKQHPPGSKRGRKPDRLPEWLDKAVQEEALRMSYRNLLGEIMARDTAARMALTGEQRYTNALAHPLAGQGGLAPDARWSVLSTENIPLEDAIVRNR